MKRSKLKLTGETYNMTPDCWGNDAIIIDEKSAIKTQTEAFDIGEDEVVTNYSDEVTIATDLNGNFYALLTPYEGTNWGRKTGKIFNENMYRECQSPSGAINGLAEIYGHEWEIFEDEVE